MLSLYFAFFTLQLSFIHSSESPVFIHANVEFKTPFLQSSHMLKRSRDASQHLMISYAQIAKSHHDDRVPNISMQFWRTEPNKISVILDIEGILLTEEQEIGESSQNFVNFVQSTVLNFNDLVTVTLKSWCVC